MLLQQGVLVDMSRLTLLDARSGFWIMQPSAGYAYQIVMRSRSRNNHVAAPRLDWVECFVAAGELQCAVKQPFARDAMEVAQRGTAWCQPARDCMAGKAASGRAGVMLFSCRASE